MFHSLSCGLYRVLALTLKVPQDKKGICSYLFPPMVFTVLANNSVCLAGHLIHLSALFFICGSNSELLTRGKLHFDIFDFHLH